MKEMRGGVTAPQGFTASGVCCGIRKKKDKKDLALVYSERPCAAAGCYTLNIVKSWTVSVTRDHLASGSAQAVIVNSGNANACTGEQGRLDAERMCSLAADLLKLKSEAVLVASTGVIGVPLPMAAIEGGMGALVSSLSSTGNADAREAIMTTDTMKKEAAVSIQIGGKEVRIGAMAKGSGMIHPNMATMLAFVTTDCAISPRLLQKALSASVERSYNRVSVDGDTSTNDMIVALANGAAGNDPIADEGDAYRAFADALDFVNVHLAKLIARDGEGATKLVACSVAGAKSDADAVVLARSVISSSLVKAALFGSDANWGRVLCALGYAGPSFSPEAADVSFESPVGLMDVFKAGSPVPFSEEKAKLVLGAQEVTILVDLHGGEGKAEAWGCDLSYEYVKINGDYRT